MKTASSILKTYWHFDRFRELQEEIIDTVCKGQDCLALLPTGGGKSLCYQVPALLLEGLALVVSPLVSLMQDQVSSLKEKDIPSEYLHSGLSFHEVNEILERAEKGQVRLLYLSPERLQNRQFKAFLPGLPLSLIAVDEAHCISQWGHDFRPEFLQVNTIRAVHKGVPLIALTASATEAVLQDIQQQLGISGAPVFRKSFRRENIIYRVDYTENKHQFLVTHFREHRGSAIIYCRSRRKTEELTLFLRQNNISAAAYHAGMSRELRSAAQQNWMQDETMVMVATTAFGMGIDKAEVRSVVHFDPPEHLEAYYQETGRAGRDGQSAQAITLYNQPDLERLNNSTALYFPPAAYLRKVYQSVCDFLQIPTGSEQEDYYDFDLSRFLVNFKLEAIPATHALRLLAQEDLWTLSDAVFRPASVIFTADRQVLDDIQPRYPILNLVSTGLLRLYSGLFHYPAVISLPALARHLKMNIVDVEQALLQLHQMNIIEYKPAKDGPQLHFHHYRVPSKDLLLDLKRIESLRSRHLARTNAMIRFLTNRQQCRNRLLLHYFDEQAPERCNHCDVCLRQRTQPAPDLADRIFDALKEQALTLTELGAWVGADQEALIGQVRRLIDEQVLRMDTQGLIHLVS